MQSGDNCMEVFHEHLPQKRQLVVGLSGCRGRPTEVERTSIPNRFTQSRYVPAKPPVWHRVSGFWICRDSRLFFCAGRIFFRGGKRRLPVPERRYALRTTSDHDHSQQARFSLRSQFSRCPAASECRAINVRAARKLQPAGKSCRKSGCTKQSPFAENNVWFLQAFDDTIRE